MKTLTIIDTFGFFFRAYYALPPLRTSDGFPTGMLTGFINFIDTLKRYYPSDYIVFALDSKGDTFRHKIDSSYKSHRKTPPEDLIQQLQVAIDWISVMGFTSLAKVGYEADDIIASVVKLATAQNIKVRILSNDKDLYQLISTNVVLVDNITRKEIDIDGCFKKFGVYPKDFIDFQAIVGDVADNIKGVKGIGIRGAAKLINKFETIDNIYKNISDAGTVRIQKLILENRESLVLSKELVILKDDIFKELDFETFRFENKNYLIPLSDDFVRFEMKHAIQKAVKKSSNRELSNLLNSDLNFKTAILDTPEKLFKVIDNIPKDSKIAFNIKTTGLDTRKIKMVGFGFSFEDYKAYYVPIAHQYLGVLSQISLKDGLKSLSKILSYNVIGHNLKFDLSLLYNQYGFNEIEPYGDSMILEWLINPSSKLNIDFLAQKYFKYNTKIFKEVVKKGVDFSLIEISLVSSHSSEIALISRLLYFKQMEILGEIILKDAYQIEYPLINILAKMEKIGIQVNQSKLIAIDNDLSKKINDLTQEIYTLGTCEFNIRSPKQLGIVLFETLGLEEGKKTKTGYRTDEAILKTLQYRHPIINKVLTYRKTYKVLSTYIKPLLALLKSSLDSRIHTSFMQTGTATGRLSSKEPNLQNVPVRSKLGRSVRDAFIARDGYQFLSIDYSQIELRLLAHFSGDKYLLDAFNNKEDIHLATAITLFGEDIAESKRNFAKSINYGILYGMGPLKLAEELSITKREAQDIIKNYFAAFPTIKNFLKDVQELMKKEGFVETINGRRRIFDYQNAYIVQKAAYLRESTNTLFQGSSADIIKMAMVEIDILIKDELQDVDMLLQLHDELIFEVPIDKLDIASQKFKYIMENIIELKVSLECTVSTGKNWGELK
ncbi:MAG: DNA polymerase I [Sulfurovum sp.]|nr:DNA polymerase I [Sulfurovaceae bacterium]